MVGSGCGESVTGEVLNVKLRQVHLLNMTEALGAPRVGS